MPSEREKMIAGELYRASDPELVAAHLRAQDLLARYNATAPIEASSGPKVRHRLNPNGNRQLNHAIHIAALGQISHNTPGRSYYLAKQADGKSRKEAMRCLKLRISDAVYRQLRADAGH